MDRATWYVKRHPWCKMVLMTVDHDLAFTLQPEVDLRMLVGMQRECFSRRHHCDTADKAVGPGLRGRDQRPKPVVLAPGLPTARLARCLRPLGPTSLWVSSRRISDW